MADGFSQSETLNDGVSQTTSPATGSGTPRRKVTERGRE